jgi:hypothetical protein
MKNTYSSAITLRRYRIEEMRLTSEILVFSPALTSKASWVSKGTKKDKTDFEETAAIPN